MPVKIRLARRGRKKSPYYHIVVADGRSPRDGKFIENLGSYDPMTRPATIELDADRALEWLIKGAQPTETARAILRFKGVMYKKHLMRGVAKGALTEEQAEAKYKEFVDEKDANVKVRREETSKEREEFLKMISGTPGKKKVIEAADKEAGDAFREGAEEVVIEAADKEAGDAFREGAEKVVAEAGDAVKAVAEKADATVEAAAEEVTETVEAVAEEATEKVEEVAEEITEAGAEATEKVEEVAEEVTEAVAEEATEKVEEVAEEITEAGAEATEKVEEVAEDVKGASEEK